LLRAALLFTRYETSSTYLSTLGLVLLSVLVPPTLACGLHTTHHGGTAVAATAIAAVVTAVGSAAA